MKHSLDTLKQPTQAISTQADLTGGLPLTVTGSATISLPGSQCAAIAFLCMKLEIPSTATYRDANPADISNADCELITKSCFPGI